MRRSSEAPATAPNRKHALRFVVMLGLVSLLADMTYEGARSITGPFLGLLGASATAVGVVAGAGELFGYGLRLVSGYVSDRTRRYWLMTLAGYAVNLLAVPALALAGHWVTAAALMIAERAGKAVRVPARDAMLSHATARVGHGWGFGLHEALDQIGAVAGPLLVAYALYLKEGYRIAFGLLLVPALLALALLLVARHQYPRPQNLEIPGVDLAGPRFPRAFWFFLAGAALLAAGYADFPLIAYHLHYQALMPDTTVPLLYAVAMGVDAVSALVFGRLFDRLGPAVLAGSALLSAFFAPLVFLGGPKLVLAGMVVWGIGMGAQESILRATLAAMIPAHRRATAFGLFNAAFGAFWFLGSAALGLLYDRSITTMVAFSINVEVVAAVVLFVTLHRR